MEKNSRILRSRGACVSVGRLSRRWTGGLADCFFSGRLARLSKINGGLAGNFFRPAAGGYFGGLQD